MSYEFKQMLKGIVETPWREMDGFAGQVAMIYEDMPEGVPPAAAMAQAMVTAAEEEIRRDLEHERAVKAAKPAGGV